VKNAVCDVLVVQTSALDEDRLRDDRLYKKEPAEAAVDGSDAAPGADSGNRSPTG
jgi:hypothetical protein